MCPALVFPLGQFFREPNAVLPYTRIVLPDLTLNLKKGENLRDAEIQQAVAALVAEEIGPQVKADFLLALGEKGETAEEIATFARHLRERSIVPPISEKVRQGEILDVCGTGGDRLNTFNISTSVAIVAAAAGAVVAKHGNRAITSQSGSADVLEELGIPITQSPEDAGRSLEEHGFAFFFAQAYHPAFKHIGPARKLCAEQGKRTLFNFLGPLLNPARPSAQLMGVPNAALCERIARVLQLLGVRRAMVVSGKVGDAFLDEISSLGETVMAEFYQDRGFNISRVHASDFRLQPATIEDLRGGDRKQSAEIILQILAGKDRSPRRDAVLLNTGAALFVANRAKSISEGMELAGEAIDSGAASRKLHALAATKRS